MYKDNKMECQTHPGEKIIFVCRSAGCNLPLLCQKCRKNHLGQKKYDIGSHTAQIISINKALELAQINLGTNKKSLKNLVEPFEKQQLIFDKIKRQKQKLIAERDKIISDIKQLFQRQIIELDRQNKQVMLKNKEKVPFDEINEKILGIQTLQSQFKKNPQKLRQALNYSEQPYINLLRKNCQTFSSMNMLQSNDYFIYDDNCKHDFYISKLELHKKSLHNKLLKKVHNESQLYFLIDNYDQGKYLHYFSSTENQLRIFDIEREKWKCIQYPGRMPTFGATVFDHRSSRFYLVGGQLPSKKSNMIIWYSQQQGWGQSQMTIPRSSCMVTLIEGSHPNHHLLVIAGGIGQRKVHLKHAQIFQPADKKFIELPPMNFGVSSGTLVTFNGTTIFKIGGLGQFSGTNATICEFAQKFDYKQFSEDKPQKWTYIELEVVNTQVQKKFKIFYANQAAIQINPNQIFVFGGWSHENMGVRQSYIIEVQTIKSNRGTKTSRYYIRWINQKRLISGQGFADLRPIIYKKRIMSLQNISHGQRQVLQKQKKLIQFNMYEWFQTENIVDI